MVLSRNRPLQKTAKTGGSDDCRSASFGGIPGDEPKLGIPEDTGGMVDQSFL